MNSIINKIKSDGFVDTGEKYVGRIFRKEIRVHTALVQVNKEEDALISFCLQNNFTGDRATHYTKYSELTKAIESLYPIN